MEGACRGLATYSEVGEFWGLSPPPLSIIGLFVASLSFMCSLSIIPAYMYILVVMCRVRERESLILSKSVVFVKVVFGL